MVSRRDSKRAEEFQSDRSQGSADDFLALATDEIG